MTKAFLMSCIIVVLGSAPAHSGWVTGQGEQTPAKGVVAGRDRNGEPYYICRAEHAGGVYPGILLGTASDCRIFHAGREYSLQNYEILVENDYTWISAYNGEIPFDALPAGKEQHGNILYICRGGGLNSEQRPGKIRQGDRECLVPNAEQEMKAPWYEVLVGN